jgi:hypothetical protein
MRQKRLEGALFAIMLVPSVGLIIAAGVTGHAWLLLPPLGWLFACMVTLLALRTRLVPARMTGSGLRFRNPTYQKAFDALNTASPAVEGPGPCDVTSSTTLHFRGTCTLRVQRSWTANVRTTKTTFMRFEADIARPPDGFAESGFQCPVCGYPLSVRVASATAAIKRSRLRFTAAGVLGVLFMVQFGSCVRDGFLPYDVTDRMVFRGVLAAILAIVSVFLAATARDAIWLMKDVRGTLPEDVPGHTVDGR